MHLRAGVPCRPETEYMATNSGSRTHPRYRRARTWRQATSSRAHRISRRFKRKVSFIFFCIFFNVSKYQDPLHVLLQYIAEVSNSMDRRACVHDDNWGSVTQKAPGCDMALVHDNDLACIDGAVCLLFINQSYRFPHCSSPWIASSLMW